MFWMCVRQASAHLVAERLGLGVGRAGQACDGLVPALAEHEEGQRPVLERVLQPREHPWRVDLVRLPHEALASLLEPRHHAAPFEGDVQHRDQRVKAVLVAPQRLHLIDELDATGPGG
jgi:hypothetical protein